MSFSSSSNASRRALIKGAAAIAGLGALPVEGQSVTTRDWSGTLPMRYPDPDVITLEKEFGEDFKLNDIGRIIIKTADPLASLRK